MTGFDDYADWKGWDAAAEPSRAQRHVWDRIHEVAGWRTGMRLLEVGCGDGAHLAHAASKGLTVEGADINPRAVEFVEARGIGCSLGGIDAVPDTQRFEAVAGFSVLEHLDAADLPEFMRSLAARLARDGSAAFVFPNGASPFGGIYQHGDLTHRTSLNQHSVDQACRPAGLAVVAYVDAPEFVRRDTLTQRFHATRRSMNRRVVRRLLQTYTPYPLGPEALCILRHR